MDVSPNCPSSIFLAFTSRNAPTVWSIFFYLAAVMASWRFLFLLVQYLPHRLSRLHFLNANSLLPLQRWRFCNSFLIWMEGNLKTGNKHPYLRESALWVFYSRHRCHLHSAGFPYLSSFYFPLQISENTGPSFSISWRKCCPILGSHLRCHFSENCTCATRRGFFVKKIIMSMFP